MIYRIHTINIKKTAPVRHYEGQITFLTSITLIRRSSVCYMSFGTQVFGTQVISAPSQFGIKPFGPQYFLVAVNFVLKPIHQYGISSPNH